MQFEIVKNESSAKHALLCDCVFKEEFCAVICVFFFISFF